MQNAKARQHGTLAVRFLVVLIALLLVVLAISKWMAREHNAAVQMAIKAEQDAAAPDRPLLSASGLPEHKANPAASGYGLSYAVPADRSKIPPDIAYVSCHGEPRLMDQPYRNSCNPYKGDTSCRVVLPVLCIQPGSARPLQEAEGHHYNGWTGGTLASTRPVMGAVLTSVQAASARCEAELGRGWRMAEFHDGPGGWEMQGQLKPGATLDGRTRYWVHINDQPGNCWNHTP